MHTGQFSAPAANEPGFEVQAELFRVDSAAAVRPAAEIEEVVWLAADPVPAMHGSPDPRPDPAAVPPGRQRTALTPSRVANEVSLAVSKKSRMYGASSMSVRTAA